MAKQHIHVSRYVDPKAVGGWEATVEPADRSWVVFVPTEGEALFYRAVDVALDNETPDAKTETCYADVEMPFSMPMQHLQHLGAPPPPMSPKKVDWPGPIDYTVTDQWANPDCPEDVKADPSIRFTALLNCRSIVCAGATEHEAVRALMNYVAQLCTAGCLDHTGEPRLVRTNKRRYQAVFGQD